MQSKDGKYVIIGGNGDSVYSRLMTAVGRPDMAAFNPLYATNTHRCQRADEIYKVCYVCLYMYFCLSQSDYLCIISRQFKTVGRPQIQAYNQINDVS